MPCIFAAAAIAESSPFTAQAYYKKVEQVLRSKKALTQQVLEMFDLLHLGNSIDAHGELTATVPIESFLCLYAGSQKEAFGAGSQRESYDKAPPHA